MVRNGSSFIVLSFLFMAVYVSHRLIASTESLPKHLFLTPSEIKLGSLSHCKVSEQQSLERFLNCCNVVYITAECNIINHEEDILLC